MAEITIYTTRFCPFCIRAKMLLEHKSQAYVEIPVDGDRARRAEMERLSGRHTVPQIWINQQHVGGCDELFALEANGEHRLKTCPVDVTDADSCAACVDATLQHFGQINLLVNNAGVVDSGPIDTFSEAAWDRIFAVNTKGIFLMTQAAVQALEGQENASIVNTASIAGKKGVRHMAAYCGSKFAAIGVTQSLAQELAPRGIRVNAICPGIVGTAMWLEHLMPKAQSTSNDIPDFADYVSQLIPMGEPQTAEDMADAVVYLARTNNVTGIALTVAGGMEMN